MANVEHISISIKKIYITLMDVPEVIACGHGTVCDGIEGLCILLKRLTFPCRYTDMIPVFGRSLTEICLIFNTISDHNLQPNVANIGPINATSKQVPTIC